MNRTPIALLAYNRPQHVERALTALLRCQRLDECRLHVFCDGPKENEPIEATRATRDMVRRLTAGHDACITERDRNHGLARSVVAAVDSLCDSDGNAIIVEDDLVVAPGFLDYMLQALDRFRDDPSVYQISAFMHPLRPTDRTDAVLLPYTATWGWATWARAWKAFEWEPADPDWLFASEGRRRRFDLEGACAYVELLQNRLAGKVDSWGILWYYAVFRAEGLVLHPSRTYVRNIGFDDTGVHCSGAYAQGALEETVPSSTGGNLRFPSEAAVDEATYRRIRRYLRAEAARDEPSLFGRVVRKARKLVRKT